MGWKRAGEIQVKVNGDRSQRRGSTERKMDKDQNVGSCGSMAEGREERSDGGS